MSSIDNPNNTNTNTNSTSNGNENENENGISNGTDIRSDSISREDGDDVDMSMSPHVSASPVPIAMDDDIARGMNEDTYEMIRQIRELTGELRQEKAQWQLQRTGSEASSVHAAMDGMNRQVTAWQKNRIEDAWDLGNIPDDIREAFNFHDPNFKGSDLYEWPEEKLMKLVDYIKPEHLDGLLGRQLGHQLPRAESLTWDKLFYKNKKHRVLLDHVTGILHAGELIGILG